MTLIVTIIIAVAGGIGYLAFTDLDAFKRLMRLCRPIAHFVAYVALGALIATIAIEEGSAPGRILNIAFVAALSGAVTMLYLGLLLWLRAGLSGFSDL